MSDKVRILVVDDEDVVRRSFVRTLASERCTVEVATDGEQALQKLREQSFDVVLLDLRMPGLGGMAVLKAIKAEWPECEVIVVTGHPMLETAKESVSLGAHDYLAKPVGPDEVINATNNALQHKRWALRREAATACHCMH